MEGALAYENLEPQFFFQQQTLGYINSLSIDPVHHQFLLCGGADSSLSIWDIDEEPVSVDEDATWITRERNRKPIYHLDRKKGHEFGVSKVSWWPFDNALFLTGSYDGTVKVWSTEELEETYSFSLDHKVYAFDVNPLEEDGLVAVGLDHPLIRLLDLRAGGSAQTLKGHQSGSVCSIKWSPTRDYMLASGGSDGTVRIWDIRQANQQVASMDMLRTSTAQPLTPLEFRRAHRAVCNGVSWHPSGNEIISVGLDNKARVWDLTGQPGGGTNKSVNFGPLFQDRRQQNLEPCISPEGDLDDDELYVLLPSDTGDLLMCQYNDGKLVRRLIPPGREIRANRQASLVARGPRHFEYFSGTCDGSVIRWRVRDLEE